MDIDPRIATWTAHIIDIQTMNDDQFQVYFEDPATGETSEPFGPYRDYEIACQEAKRIKELADQE